MRTVIEGLVRIGFFVLYVLLISRMEDIQRTFMYHVQSINALTVLNMDFAHSRECKEELQTA